VAHQHDVGGLRRDVRSRRAHGNADVRLRQRRRVVDAVAQHGDFQARCLHLSNALHLLVGQQFGGNVRDARPLRHDLRGVLSISRQQRDMGNAHPLQFRHCLSSICSEGILCADDANNGLRIAYCVGAPHRHKDRSVSLVVELSQRVLSRLVKRNPFGLQQARTADDDS